MEDGKESWAVIRCSQDRAIEFRITISVGRMKIYEEAKFPEPREFHTS